MHKKIFSVFLPLVLSLTLFLSGCGAPEDGNPDFHTYLDRLFVREMKQDTLSMHYTVCDPAAYGITDYRVCLPDYSADSQAEIALLQENIRYQLNSYSECDLSLSDALTYDILQDYFRAGSTEDISYYEEPLRPSTGFPAELPVLLAEYHFYTEQDVKDYLLLLQQIPDCFVSICDYEKEKANAGLFMSDGQADTLIADMNSLCDTTEKHYLLETFEEKIGELEGLTDIQRKDYISENESSFYEYVIPSYQLLIDCLTELKGSCTNDAGLCYFPEGLSYYEDLVYASTGSSRSIDEMLDLVERHRLSDIRSMSELLNDNPDLTLDTSDYAYADASPEEILTHLSQCICGDFSAPVSTDFTVNYVADCMQESMAPAFYLTAPIDATDQNCIYINPSSNYDDLSLFTTLAHEGYPGHLYQTTKTASAGLLPIRSLLNYPGYVEGWATYVEMLSYSYAGLPQEQASLLMHNQSAILSLYATADLSIHGKGWTLNDTQAFFSEYGITDADIVKEIYSYILSEPAHYLKYYIGYLEFLELKDYAKRLSGDDYTDQRFHDAILTMGPGPFDILREYLPEYMNQ
ncbi:MAG: DUF885 domain-containing protein [Roseburia sp.]